VLVPSRSLERASFERKSVGKIQPLEAGTEGQSEEFRTAVEAKKQGKLEEACQIYEEILKIWPENAAARLNFGVCLMEMGKTEEAIALYKAGTDIIESPGLLFNQAIGCMWLKQPSEALNLLNKAENLPLNENFPISEVKRYLQSFLSPAPHRSPILANFTHSSISESPFESFPEHSQPGNTAASLSGSRRTAAVAKTPDLLGNRKQSLWNVFKSIDEIAYKCEDKPKKRHFTPVLIRIRSKSPGDIKGKSLTPVRISRNPKKKRQIEPYLTEEDYNPFNIPSESDSNPGKKKPPPMRKMRKNGVLMQEDLEDESKLKQVQFDTEQELAMHEKFAEVRGLIQTEADKLASAVLFAEENGEKSLLTRLTQDHLATVRSLLKRRKRDNQEENVLLTLLSPLKFFTRFQKEVRAQLLAISEYRYSVPGETIFTQGEAGTIMYVLLHGSVLVQQSSTDLGDVPLTISTLYDGDSFGELSLFQMQGERGSTARAVTCVAGEACDLLEIPKLCFHNIIMQQVETAIEAKINFLLSLSIFAGVERVNLVPLVTNLEPVKFQFDEILVNKGEKPKGMHILVSGICKVYADDFPLKDAVRDQYVSLRMQRSPSVQPFHTGLEEFHKVKKPIWVIHPEKKGQRSYSARSLLPIVSHKAQLHLATLQTGDYFGGRCLSHSNPSTSPDTDTVISPSTCSVVAESSDVSVFLLTPAHMKYLGEKLAVRTRQETVMSRIARGSDADCPVFLGKREFQEDCLQWKRYKREMVDLAYRGWFVDKHRHRIISAIRDQG
jgi:CRP-like cAMP-binding protein/tetratricopeptide (TPR) repeat protein